jgi:hypothetical protein
MAGRYDLTVVQRLERFLQGSGVPCPELFKAAQEVFSPIIDLSQVSAESFRARMLVWATTGSPFIDPGASDTINVSLQPLGPYITDRHSYNSDHYFGGE